MLKDFFHGLFNIFINYIVKNIPFVYLRYFLYSLFFNMGKSSNILMGVRFLANNITIGSNSIINYGCLLDSRGSYIKIGNNVDISPYVHIWTMYHDPDSNNYNVIKKPVIIEDYAWIATGALILPGVRIGKGAIIAAGSVVTKDVGSMEIVAGNPAKKIRMRQSSLSYCLNYKPWLN